MSLRRALCGFAAVSSLVLSVETFLDHRGVVGEHLIAWAPILVSLLGLFVFAVVFLRWHPKLFRLVQGVGVILIFVGLLGLYFHNAERFGISREPGGPKEEHTAPPLASLALSGLGFLGVMATYPHWREEGA